ncbi:hypothetical protein C4J89_4613 [Pseudomonas sp. R4-35-07]|nr:hypothetical protein C4J90_4605 [Pseudomonas sp. R2-60-08W]AZF34050.1 hypothetical protein C4J89_4613 [Pseudomonas sp. R4-35-07]
MICTGITAIPTATLFQRYDKSGKSAPRCIELNISLLTHLQYTTS